MKLINRIKRLFSGLLALLLVTALASCKSNKELKSGSFTLSYPSDLNIVENSNNIPQEYLDYYPEYHYLMCLEENANYKREFRSPEECVFELAVLIDPGEDGLSIEDYTKARLKSLSGNNNIWSVISTIEKKEDSIITRAAPYYEAVQDMGVHYFRFFKKDGKVALIDITVREEADEKYRKAVETILKTAK